MGGANATASDFPPPVGSLLAGPFLLQTTVAKLGPPVSARSQMAGVLRLGVRSR